MKRSHPKDSVENDNEGETPQKKLETSFSNGHKIVSPVKSTPVKSD
jgi:hypothetical protein